MSQEISGHYYQSYQDFIETVINTFELYIHNTDLLTWDVEQIIESTLEMYLPLCEQDMLGILNGAPLEILTQEPTVPVCLPNRTLAMNSLVGRLAELTQHHLRSVYSRMRFDRNFLLIEAELR